MGGHQRSAICGASLMGVVGGPSLNPIRGASQSTIRGSGLTSAILGVCVMNKETNATMN